MSSLIIGTNVISHDEPCFGLRDEARMAPDFSGLRHYRVLKILRNDRIVEARLDLGPVKRAEDVLHVTIPGGVYDEATGRGEILHTVGELVDIYEWASRAEQPERTSPPIDWKQSYLDTLDARKRRRRGRRQFGHTATQGR